MGAYKVDTFTIYTEFWSAIRAFEEFMADGNARFSHGDHDFVLRREKHEEWSIVETESNRPWGVFMFYPSSEEKTEFGAGSRGSRDETYEAVSFYVEKFMGHLREKELLYPPRPAQPVKTDTVTRDNESKIRHSGRRKRGPAPDVLADCKRAMEYWLDQDKPLNIAAQLAGRDDQTVLRWIPKVLDDMPSDKCAIWVDKITAQGRERHLGKHREVKRS